MSNTDSIQQFEAKASNGTDAAFEFLEEYFRGSGDYHRLFDTLKMKLRRSLGLGLLHRQDDPPLNDKTHEKLEIGLMDACREIATLYLAKGDLNEGWTYLQPLGDEPFAREQIESVPIDDDNFGAVIEIAFNHGISPIYGYRVMLEKTGTCNGITAFDVHALQFDRETIAGLASTLLQHFYGELLANVIDHVQRVKGNVDESASLGELLNQHNWLVREGGHHADATHLASVIRIARQTTTREDHEKALELARYGCRLGEDFQFSSEPPFDDLYEDHRAWYEALTGRNVDAAIKHFTDKADSAKGQYSEVSSAEALIDLQIRTGKREAAVASAVERLLSLGEKDSLPPSLFEIAQSPDQFEKLAEAFREDGNFAGFAFAMMCRDESRSGD